MDFNKRDGKKLQNVIKIIKKFNEKHPHVFLQALTQLEQAKSICKQNKPKEEE